jgi:hypothetical protein
MMTLCTEVLSHTLINFFDYYLTIMANGTIVKSVTDVLAICSDIFESAKNEIVYISPPSLLVFASQYGINNKEIMFIQNGGHVRGITDFSHPYVEVIRENLAIGENVRHYSRYQGVFMLVGDERESISSINIDAENLSLNTPVVTLWSQDPTYAEYLVSTFEIAWGQSVPAEERIEELLKEGPPQV